MSETCTNRPPNIILMNCDDLGYGDLGCYGSQINDTPYLDRMAEEGVRFTDFYMASPVCSASRAALMTGCYPLRVGFERGVLFPGDPWGLSTDEITVAGLLKRNGYATKVVGKWHLGDQPEFLPMRHGFDSYYGIPYSNDMGRQHKEDKHPPLPLLRDDQVIQEQPDQSGLTERYVEESVRFIRDNADRPFFLYLAHMHVHLPLYPAPRFLNESRNGRYGGCVAAIDWAAGVLLDEIDALGLDNDTLVLFTSDNGSRLAGQGGSNDPLRGAKASTWEGGQRVPLIVRWSGHIPAGRTCMEMAASMDILPTLAGFAGIEAPGDRPIDGVDIRPLFLGETLPPASLRQTFFYYRGGALEAVRHGDYKLHVRKGDQEMAELYNLREDIGETRNVYAGFPDVVQALTALLQACREDLGDTITQTSGANNRPIGEVGNPDTLTHYDPTHPYIMAEYDLPERG